MAYLNTLLGTIDPEEMGFTAMHEHIMWGPPGWQFNPGVWFDIGKVFEKCYNDLMDFKLQGGETYVDCSGIGVGRDLDLYVRLATSTNLHIIASTGLSADGAIAPHFREKDIDFFEELFVRELTRGMGRTGIKAGVIRVANGANEITELEDVGYRAAARAAKQTGAPVFTHGINFALRQLEILEQEGLDLSRVVVSQCDQVIDFERDQEIARKGAYVSYDNIGLEEWSKMAYAVPDARRVELVRAMLEAGFQDQIILSATSSAWRLGWGETYLSNVGHTPRYFVPLLKETGIGDDAINAIFIDNPKQVLPMQ